jgi:hypothetical protein
VSGRARARPGADLSPRRLVEVARTVLDEPAVLAGPAWPRAVALLTRQALEGAVSGYWERRAPGMAACNNTAQLLALRFYADETVAAEAYQAWCSLSEACHHHGYDLAPTAGELAGWLDTVAEVVERLSGRAG